MDAFQKYEKLLTRVKNGELQETMELNESNKQLRYGNRDFSGIDIIKTLTDPITETGYSIWHYTANNGLLEILKIIDLQNNVMYFNEKVQ